MVSVVHFSRIIWPKNCLRFCPVQWLLLLLLFCDSVMLIKYGGRHKPWRSSLRDTLHLLITLSLISTKMSLKPVSLCCSSLWEQVSVCMRWTWVSVCLSVSQSVCRSVGLARKNAAVSDPLTVLSVCGLTEHLDGSECRVELWKVASGAGRQAGSQPASSLLPCAWLIH